MSLALLLPGMQILTHGIRQFTHAYQAPACRHAGGGGGARESGRRGEGDDLPGDVAVLAHDEGRGDALSVTAAQAFVVSM